MKRKLLLTIAILIFAACAVFAGYKIVTILAEYRAGESTYQAVQQYISLPAENGDLPNTAQPDPAIPAATQEAEPAAAEETVDFPNVDFDALLALNEDVVGWVYIENTNINYPVVQGKNNDQYLSRMIDGTYNAAGSIFMDCRNRPDMTDPHTILYGHNMKNGTMFADICRYRDQAYYDAHPMGLYMTPDGNYRFEILAAYVAAVQDPAWQLEFSSDEEAFQWLQNAMGRSGFVSRTTPVMGERMITLSTCSYEFNNARFVLVGVLK